MDKVQKPSINDHISSCILILFSSLCLRFPKCLFPEIFQLKCINFSSLPRLMNENTLLCERYFLTYFRTFTFNLKITGLYTWSSTYDLCDLDRPHLRPQKIINKLIINQDVLLRTPIIQDSVRFLSWNIWRNNKQIVQTKLRMFLIKETSSTSTQEHDPNMYCTVSLSKRQKH
jgi:hypothetical protein